MIKSELILRVAAENPHLYEADVERVVNTILGRISDAFVAGDCAELRGLGTLTVKERSPRTARSPRTGVAVPMGTRRLPVFKPSKTMHARMNPSGTATSAQLDAEVERQSRTSQGRPCG